MDDAEAELLAFSAFPGEPWTTVWSTNAVERRNKELKRSARDPRSAATVTAGHLRNRGFARRITAALRGQHVGIIIQTAAAIG